MRGPLAAACVLLAGFVATPVLAQGYRARFTEVTKSVGIDSPPADKTSGPSIGDLNQDGYLDIIQCNHAREPVEFFYGSRSGNFTRVEAFVEKFDRHGTAIADYDGDGFPDVILSVGITTLTRPRDPPMIERTTGPGIGEIEAINTNLIGLGPSNAQGPGSRAAVRMADLDNDGDLDMFLLARNYSGGLLPHHSVFENRGNGRFQLDRSTGAEMGPEYGLLFLDYNGDGLMDILMFSIGLHLLRNNGRTSAAGISFTEVTDQVLPSRYRMPIGGAAELDFNNDGLFDLYLAGGNRVKGPGQPGDDVLLRNNGDGTFSDISRRAGLPRGGVHIGITVSDFDNNGHMDVFIPRAAEGLLDRRIRDIILLNNGNGSFRVIDNHGANGPTDGTDETTPTGAQAFDYDKDGRVDVVVATRNNPFDGKLRLFKNLSPRQGNYIIVQVPVFTRIGGRKRSLMDAVVRVTTGSGRRYYRRVGSVGETRTQSFIDQVHFGIGAHRKIQNINVTLTSGHSFATRKATVNSVRKLRGG